MPSKAHPALRAAVQKLALPESVLKLGIRKCELVPPHNHTVKVSYGLKNWFSIGLAIESVSSFCSVLCADAYGYYNFCNQCCNPKGTKIRRHCSWHGKPLPSSYQISESDREELKRLYLQLHHQKRTATRRKPSACLPHSTPTYMPTPTVQPFPLSLPPSGVNLDVQSPSREARRCLAVDAATSQVLTTQNIMSLGEPDPAHTCPMATNLLVDLQSIALRDADTCRQHTHVKQSLAMLISHHHCQVA